MKDTNLLDMGNEKKFLQTEVREGEL